MKSSWPEYQQADTGMFFPVEHIYYAETALDEQSLYLTVPRNKKNLPLVIFFPGGGFTQSSRECPRNLFNGDFAVAEVRYRLSQTEPAPAAMEDAAKAIAWCFEHAPEYGIDRKRIFAGGMSAGAYLAAITVMKPSFLAPYNLSSRDIAGLPLISGQMTTHFQVKCDLKRDNGRYNPLIDEYAPISYFSADLPPMLLITGDSERDIPARPEENAYAAASLKAMGHKFIRFYSLQGHGHVECFFSCGQLLMRFLYDVLKTLSDQ